MIDGKDTSSKISTKKSGKHPGVMTHQTILIVEDEKKIAELLRDYLEKVGYRVSSLYRGIKSFPLLKNLHPL